MAGDGPSDTGSPHTPNESHKVPLWRSGVILLVAVFVGLAYWFNPPLNVQPQAGVVMDLPILVGDYFGKEGEITKVELDILPKDTEFARRFYDDGHGHQINCSIVLSGAEQRSIHRPEVCLVGQGWTITGQEDVPIPLPSGHKLVARKLSLERHLVGKNDEHITVRAFYVYWFVGQNVTTPSHFTRIFLSNWDRAVHNRAHRWAYVSLFSLVTDNLRADGLNPQDTQAMIVDFAGKIVPTFQISEMAQQAKN
jgi:Protein of unknown function (DUF3485)